MLTLTDEALDALRADWIESGLWFHDDPDDECRTCDGDGWTIDAMHAQVAREGEALIRQLCILNSGVAVHSVRCVEVVTSSKVRP